MAKLNELSLKETIEGLTAKRFSSKELVEECIVQIETLEPQINALVTPTFEEARTKAKEADKVLSAGTGNTLTGVPFLIKDNFSTKGIRTTASSKVLDDYIPPFDATVVKKLKDAGIILMGKTNMDAFAHGSSTETSDYGTTKNPWNINHLPGGSSGGSAAAVSAEEAIASIGTETAGSIRQPAAWCGVVGLKPTYGRVSRYGVVAMGSSLDSPGPITKTVEDAAIILQILAGKDEMDATTLPNPVPNYIKNLNDPIEGLKIGISDDYFEDVNPEVKEKVMKALKVFEKMGAVIKNIKLFPPRYSIAVYTIIQRSEVSSNLARYDGIRFGNTRDSFGEEAKRRIMLGTYTLSAGYYDQYYNKAQKVRTIIVDDFKNAFKEVDVIIAPTSPTTALPLGASANSSMFGELQDVLVEPSSIAGLPGINIPVGFDTNGLPIGMQIIGPQLAEVKILNVANKFEQATDFHTFIPEIAK